MAADLQIRVTEPTKCAEKLSSYIRYKVLSKCSREGFKRGDFSVFRRYGDFKWFSDELARLFQHEAEALPTLPPKQASSARSSAKYVEARRDALEKYLESCIQHSLCGSSAALSVFLFGSDAELSEAKEVSRRMTEVKPRKLSWATVTSLITGSNKKGEDLMLDTEVVYKEGSVKGTLKNPDVPAESERKKDRLIKRLSKIFTGDSLAHSHAPKTSLAQDALNALNDDQSSEKKQRDSGKNFENPLATSGSRRVNPLSHKKTAQLSPSNPTSLPPSPSQRARKSSTDSQSFSQSSQSLHNTPMSTANGNSSNSSSNKLPNLSLARDLYLSTELVSAKGHLVRLKPTRDSPPVLRLQRGARLLVSRVCVEAGCEWGKVHIDLFPPGFDKCSPDAEGWTLLRSDILSDAPVVYWAKVA